MGLEFVRRGYGVYFLTGDLPWSEYVEVFNLFASHSGYAGSNFPAQAKTYHEIKMGVDLSGGNKELEISLRKFRRQFGIDDDDVQSNEN